MSTPVAGGTPPGPATLAEVRAAIDRELASACTQRGHGWRHAVLATRDGEGADARTVVLREWAAESGVLRLYTDARSPKVAQVQAHPDATLVLWCPALGWQLRLRVRLMLQADGLAVASRWARLKLTRAAQDYLAPAAPGAPLEGRAGVLDERSHFALLEARVQRLDWLELAAPQHRRAVFENGEGRWVIP